MTREAHRMSRRSGDGERGRPRWLVWFDLIISVWCIVVLAIYAIAEVSR